MNKRHDYRARLYAYVDSVRNTPFAYGTHDCALFTAGAVQAMTGEDPAAPFRGRYRTAIGGLRKMRAAGFEDQVDFVARTFDEVSPATIQMGDICLTSEGALGVCVGDRVAVAGEHGLRFVPLAHIQRGFR